MRKEEVEYEILKIFASKINFEFESFQDLWDKYSPTLHCTRDVFNEILSEFKRADYIGVSVNGHFTSTTKSRRAYFNHHIGRYKGKRQQEREREKFNQELKALQFTNSKGFKVLTIVGMFMGIIGGVFGIASYYKNDGAGISQDQLKNYVDSARQIDNSNYVNFESVKKHIDSIEFNNKKSSFSDITSKGACK